MSAIFGLIHFDGRPIDVEALHPALSVLAHRGPDGQSRWQEGSVLLAHWMLHTTPESLYEQQPLVACEGDLVLVADARIDNRDELLSMLQLRSNAERPVTDAELILAAYRRWGTDCPDRLIGDFAFAIWDRLARRMFAARDGIGMRPFYYFHDGRRFAFATLLPALGGLPEVPQDIDEAMILRFLTQQAGYEKARTFYLKIQRLPGGHALQVNAQRLHIWQYWQPNLETLQLKSETAYVEAFRSCFEEAVRCRLRSAFPIGSQLSGGLDSSSVTSMAAYLLQDGCQRLHSFSAVFPNVPQAQQRWIDERAYVAAVHRRYPQIIPHFLRADQESPLVALEEVLARYGQPFLSANYYLPYRFAQLARAQNIRIMLNGLDGDSVISHGWERLSQLWAQQQWQAFIQETNALAARQETNASALARRLAGPILKTWARQFHWHKLIRGLYWLQHAYALPAFELIRSYGIWPLMPESLYRWWQRQRGRLGEAEALSPMVATWEKQQKRKALKYASNAEAHWDALTNGLWQTAFEFEDVIERSLGIESRAPFFDRRLVELSVRLPLEWKLRNGWTRYILRVGLEGVLPVEVQWRTSKSNIGYGFRQGLLRYEQARLQQLAEKADRLSPYVTAQALNQQMERLLQDVENMHHNADFVLYLLCILHAWFDHDASRGDCIMRQKRMQNIPKLIPSSLEEPRT